MGAVPHVGKLHCPYETCRKSFEKPIVLTDSSQLMRETYYACPHCRSKIEIVPEDPANPRLVSVEDAFSFGPKSPANCSHHFGYLRELPESSGIPDECAVCPKVMQCFVRNDRR